VPWATFCIRCQEAKDRNQDRNVEEMGPDRDLLGRAA
jgi:RNA polymerase-binding transcription factor DksA